MCSNFTPTCAECSTPFPAPGVVAVRGESAMAICRHCHRKMGMHRIDLNIKLSTDLPLVLKIPEVKFLIVGSAACESMIDGEFSYEHMLIILSFSFVS